MNKRPFSRDRDRDQSARENRHVRGKAPSAGAKDEGDLLQILASNKEPFFLILDCVQDPHNLGAILRSADGAGVDAVIAPRDKSCGLTDTVRRISVGAADSIPFVQVTNLARTMQQLQEKGVWIVGTGDEESQSIYETSLTGPIALVMGSEEKGIRRLTEEHCDFLVKLPMAGKVECLNVSVATGICLYEAVRQRSAAKKAE